MNHPSTLHRSLSAIGLVSVALIAFACSKPRTPTPASIPEQPAPATKAAAEDPAASAPAAKPAPAPTPAAATKTGEGGPASAKKPEKPARKYSVVPHFSRKDGGAFELPIAGKPALVRLLPVEDSGASVGELAAVLGGKLAVLVVANNRKFADLAVFDEVPPKGGVLPVKFPLGGSHVAWSLFSPAGGAAQAIPTYFNVEGKEVPADDDPEDGRHARTAGLEVALVTDEAIEVCGGDVIGTVWARGTKVVSLDKRIIGDQTVQYVAIDQGGTKVVLAEPTQRPLGEPAGVAGDDGTHAKLRLPAPGRWYVWAFTTYKKKRLAARFFLDAKGEVPAGGCR